MCAVPLVINKKRLMVVMLIQQGFFARLFEASSFTTIAHCLRRTLVQPIFFQQFPFENSDSAFSKLAC